jgi:hypothetical protein
MPTYDIIHHGVHFIGKRLEAANPKEALQAWCVLMGRWGDNEYLPSRIRGIDGVAACYDLPGDAEGQTHGIRVVDTESGSTVLTIGSAPETEVDLQAALIDYLQEFATEFVPNEDYDATEEECLQLAGALYAKLRGKILRELGDK